VKSLKRVLIILSIILAASAGTAAFQEMTVILAGEDFPSYALTKSLSEKVGAKIGVIVLTSDNPADYAVGKVLARRLNTSVVTTPWGNMSQNATKVIENSGFKTVYVVGGEIAISGAEEELKRINVSVLRFGGEDRFETSSSVAGIWGNSPRILIAQGFDREGILDAIKEEAEDQAPLIYIRPNTIPESVENIIINLNVSHALLIPSPDTEVLTIETILRKHNVIEIDVQSINKSKRTAVAIEEANKALIDAISTSTEYIDAKAIASLKLLALAKEDFVVAQNAYNEENYSNAFAHAVAARYQAEEAARILSGQIIGRLKDLVKEVERQLVPVLPYHKVSIGELVLTPNEYNDKKVEVEGNTRSPPLNIGDGIYIQIFDEVGRTAIVMYTGSDIDFINAIKKDDTIRAKGTVRLSPMFEEEVPGAHQREKVIMIDATGVEILT
jgi:putative cell wall-binding protein